ncbi:transporter substrate-binding domain-containing protein [Microlunatus speluncae]|uniref:transporter substrate-binding domain-containing protein n=1 Tax=Microlunatus speluncae TaxID=2594267 RepID=UPI001FE50B32|nr:transporter substrate-binding domain-containing protein [Microlunatus speluncae]
MITSSRVINPARAVRLAVIALAGVAIMLTTACGYQPTPLPEPVPSAAPSTGAPTQAPECTNPLASYQPEGSQPQPGAMPAGSTMSKIAQRGRVIAGVSADTYLLGSRNPLTGKIEGFDIDLVKAVAKAILGDENAYTLRVITAADRIPLLKEGKIDIVVRNMTINCERWQQIAFSTVYYQAGQKIMVRKGSDATSLADLDGQKVCAPNGTSSMQNLIAKAPKAIPVGADNHTGCLVLFQRGDVDAITGDDTVLAGLADQDPYAEVPKQKAFTAEPYGIGVKSDQRDLVRFINGTLDQLRANGEWTKIYNRWLAGPLGPAPQPPKASYGRTS